MRLLSECVHHPGAMNSSGYGSVRYQGKRVGAHAAAYLRHHGLPVDACKGKVVMHSCDNRMCINPEHLSLGTQSQNILDALHKGRLPQAHQQTTIKLTAADIVFIKQHYVAGKNQTSPGNKVELARKFSVNEQTIRKVARGYYDYIKRD